MKSVITFIPKLPSLKQAGLNVRTDNRPVCLTYKGEEVYAAEPLVWGNAKLDKSIGIFDLLAVTACPNCKDCAKGCYARRTQALRAACHDKRAVYTALAFEDCGRLARLISEQLSARLNRPRGAKPKAIRIHSSGDFISQRYVNMWAAIAAYFSKKYGIKFYTYTKCENLFDFSKLSKYCNIVKSVLPDGSINFAPEAEIEERCARLNVKVCPCRPGRKVKCGLDCTMCYTEPYMGFVKH